jgi:hypothetical protein
MQSRMTDDGAEILCIAVRELLSRGIQRDILSVGMVRGVSGGLLREDLRPIRARHFTSSRGTQWPKHSGPGPG